MSRSAYAPTSCNNLHTVSWTSLGSGAQTHEELSVSSEVLRPCAQAPSEGLRAMPEQVEALEHTKL